MACHPGGANGCLDGLTLHWPLHAHCRLAGVAGFQSPIHLAREWPALPLGIVGDLCVCGTCSVLARGGRGSGSVSGPTGARPRTASQRPIAPWCAASLPMLPTGPSAVAPQISSRQRARISPEPSNNALDSKAFWEGERPPIEAYEGSACSAVSEPPCSARTLRRATWMAAPHRAQSLPSVASCQSVGMGASRRTIVASPQSKVSQPSG